MLLKAKLNLPLNGNPGVNLFATLMEDAMPPKPTGSAAAKSSGAAPKQPSARAPTARAPSKTAANKVRCSAGGEVGAGGRSSVPTLVSPLPAVRLRIRNVLKVVEKSLSPGNVL